MPANGFHHVITRSAKDITKVFFLIIISCLKPSTSSYDSGGYDINTIYYKKTSVSVTTKDSEILLNDYRCRGLEDLLDRTNASQFDPDEHLDVPQIIRRHGYPSETHVVETADGYLLKVHRIPGDKEGKKGGQPAFLQHGLFGSSADWVLNGNNTLAFYLADNGYDVWLGNARGNVYSRAHISLSVHSPEFWNFTWHEMAIQDLPAVLYHISNTTGKPGEIIYIGHSMGTTMSFVFASSLPQAAKNLKVIITLAPTVYLTHLRSPLRYLAPFSKDLSWIARVLGLNELNVSNKLLSLLSYQCLKNYCKPICENIIFAIGGFNENETNLTILPKILAHDPAGTSTKTVIHYAQEIQSGGKFQQYDYGPEGNMEKYGTPTPPEYKIEKIKRPFYLIYAENDILTSYIDVERLAKELPSLVKLYKVPGDTFGHVDFVFGIHAFDYVYKPIVNFLRNYTMESEMDFNDL